MLAGNNRYFLLYRMQNNIYKVDLCWNALLHSPRLRSCEAACELLTKYRNGHDVEKVDLSDFETGLRNQKIEDLGPSEAELELERLRVSPSPPYSKKSMFFLSIFSLLQIPCSHRDTVLLFFNSWDSLFKKKYPITTPQNIENIHFQLSHFILQLYFLSVLTR